MRKTDEELRAARLTLNTPDGFAISKDVIRDLIDEVLELRDYVGSLHCVVCKAELLPSSEPRCHDCVPLEDSDS